MYAGLRHRRRGGVRARRSSLVVGVGAGAGHRALGVPPFVVTLGSMLLLRGVAEVLTGGTRHRLPGQVPRLSLPGRRDRRSGMPMPFWFALGADRDHRVPDAPDAVRALLLRDRLERRGGAAVGRPGARIRLVTFVGAALPVGRGRHPLRRLPADARRRRSATPTSCTPSRRRCWAAARCRAARGSVFGVLIGAGIMQITFNAVNLVGQVAVAERRRGRRDPGGGHRRPRCSKRTARSRRRRRSTSTSNTPSEHAASTARWRRTS